MQVPPRYRIAIVGAGTAGLAAAAFLAHHHVTVFEKFDAPKPLGAGLLIQPTGLACLAALGVDDAALDLGHVIHRIQGRTASKRIIFDLDYAALGPNCFGLAMHRAALFDVLYRAVLARSTRIVTATEIVASTFASHAPPGQQSRSRHDLSWYRTLVDSVGQTHGPFDLVIDASGLRSRLRAAEAQVRLDRPYPYGAVWGALEMPRDWPHRHALVQRYEGAHVMCGILPVGRRPGEQIERAAFFWSLRTADMAAWQAGDLDAWKARVLQLWPEVAPFLEQVRTTGDLTPARYADLWLKQPYADNLFFVGDAARAASPQLGQGANLALIDAFVLSRMIDQEVPRRMGESYAKARRAHTRFYGLASRALTPFFQSDSRLAAGVRDLAFAPMARVPYMRREMVRTLAGMKTGLFSSLDPGSLHPRYALSALPGPGVIEPFGKANT
jgi:salicylate hydroxylase